jgi:CheY-like chemotaxis protein
MSKRILVMEDEKDSRQIIRDMLGGIDCEITEAEDAEQALAAIAKERLDLILMGIHLPIMKAEGKGRGIFSGPPSDCAQGPTQTMIGTGLSNLQGRVDALRMIGHQSTWKSKFQDRCLKPLGHGDSSRAAEFSSGVRKARSFS